MKNTIQRMETPEYYIGLKKESNSGEWRWLSDNSKVNATRGKFPWAIGEPSGDGNCVVMYRNYRRYYGLFNDLRCTTKTPLGYICESPVDSNDQEGMCYTLLYVLFIATSLDHIFSFQIAPYKLLLIITSILTH